MRFKDYLVETAVGKKPTYTHLQVEEAISLLNEHCKNALWMLEKNLPIYRGDSQVNLKTGFATVDPTKTTRESTNTTNYYTEIFDHHPEMTEYPKRSRSFISTTNFDYARDYANRSAGSPWRTGFDALPNVLIPFDSVKIGGVGNWDMHEHYLTIFGRDATIDRWNSFYRLYLKIEPKWKAFVDFQKQLDSGDNKAIRRFKDCFGESAKPSKFLEEIYRAYSPENLGFSLYTTKTLPKVKTDEELWVGGPCVLIKYEMWRDMRAALKSKGLK